ncbi:MAG: glycosyltransferase [Chloroflexi bacterium]|nr:glycosyltransferase [Chloroflexota bacterium]
MGGFYRVAAWVASPLTSRLRSVDLNAAKRVDLFVANSRFTAARIAHVYHRAAPVVYPPVEVERIEAVSARYDEEPSGDYYLAVGQHIPAKEFDVIIEACRLTGNRVTIVGAPGPADRYLPLRGTEYVTFEDFADDERLAELLAKCRAFIGAGFEDFGIAAVEALAAGHPVIARKHSGTEEVIEGSKGCGMIFQPKGKDRSSVVEALAETLRGFDQSHFDREACRERARLFSRDMFDKTFRALVDREVQRFREMREQVRVLWGPQNDAMPG